MDVVFLDSDITLGLREGWIRRLSLHILLESPLVLISQFLLSAQSKHWYLCHPLYREASLWIMRLAISSNKIFVALSEQAPYLRVLESVL